MYGNKGPACSNGKVCIEVLSKFMFEEMQEVTQTEELCVHRIMCVVVLCACIKMTANESIDS